MTDSARARGRVTVFAAEFPPIGGGGVIRMAKLAKYLPVHGWDVTVVCSEEPLAEAVDETLLADIPGSVRIVRIGSPARRLTAGATAKAKASLRRKSVAFRLLYGTRAVARNASAIPDRWIGWALKAGRLDREALGGPHVILTSGPPHSVHLAGMMASRRLNVPFVMDLRDEWASNPYYRTRLPWRRWIERYFEQWCIARANLIVLVSETSRLRYSRRYRNLADRFIVIPNGFDPDDLPQPRYSAILSPNRITIGHAGSLRDRRDASSVLRAARDLIDQDELDLHLHLVGPISTQQEELARSVIPAARLTIETFLPHREALQRMSDCDVLLVLSSYAEAGPAALTGKVFECLALGKPILAVAPRGALATLMEKTRGGFWADPSDPNSVRNAMRKACLASKDGFLAVPDSILDKYDRGRQAGQWARCLAAVV